MSRNRAAKLPPGRALGEVLDFMRLLWALDHALQMRSKRMQAELGITGPQRLVIRIVGRYPGIPAGQLAEILHLHPSTLTGILARLQRRGLITRRSDPRDRRRSLLGLSARGRVLDVDAEGTVEAAIRAAFASLPREKLRAAAQVLGELARSLEPDSVGVERGRGAAADPLSREAPATRALR